jgi:adenine-specific DNA-methyltransferase
VHERIDPRTIIEAVRKRNGNASPKQLSLFEEERQEPLREAIEFYRHKHGWTNRLIAGDSLLVMNSLLEKEGMAGKVQMTALRHQIRLQLPALRQQARREGWQGRGFDQ